MLTLKTYDALNVANSHIILTMPAYLDSGYQNKCSPEDGNTKESATAMGKTSECRTEARGI